MNNNLTDAEIIKALECCGKNILCIHCPLHEMQQKEGLACCDNLKLLALDLINRLQAEKEALINGQETLQKHIATLQAENERLKNAYKQVAWERDIFAEDMKEEIKKDCSYLMLDIKTIKAEAYKECIEKLNSEIHQALESNYKARAERIEKHNVGETDEFISYCQGKIDCLRGLDNFLDNLLKELVGEENG